MAEVLWIGGGNLPVAEVMAEVGAPVAWDRVAPDPVEVRRRIGAAEVVVTAVFTREMAEAAHRLRFIQCYTNGLDGLDWSAIPPGVTVARVSGHGTSVAEHALGLWLAVAKQIALSHRHLLAHQWTDGYWGNGPFLPELSGQRALAVGLGEIARAFMALTAGFRLTWRAVRRHPERGGPPGVEVAGVEALAAWCEWADLILVAAPLTDETRGLIGRDVLRHANPRAILVNVARADLIDHAALYEALTSGRLAGAGLDLPTTVPGRAGEAPAPFGDIGLEALPNVVVTPHVAAWTEATQRRRLKAVASNLRAWFAGAPLRHQVAGPAASSEVDEE
ncbi:MAG: hypothetical protein K6U14_04370 [Firmicutes bacterium]|nr:hypothetical protein [Alicyclobacillaceae bacterium]MCL6496856.1 hypothetical protein [Bacillota bacterium]